MLPTARHANLRLLIDTDRTRIEIFGDRGFRDRLSCYPVPPLARRVERLREIDFGPCPASDDWIRRSRDVAGMRLAAEAFAQELRLSSRVCAVPARLYGGIKSQDSIARRIRSFEEGKEPLDLWDLVRFRIVTPDLDALEKAAQDIQRYFGSKITRCRNYYTRPRKGPADPYRAVHFEVDLGGGWFGEIQLLTARREAVGLVDYAYLHRCTLAPLSKGHADWLRDLSYAANICDLGPARD
jgi:hypothetical protein